MFKTNLLALPLTLLLTLTLLLIPTALASPMDGAAVTELQYQRCNLAIITLETMVHERDPEVLEEAHARMHEACGWMRDNGLWVRTREHEGPEQGRYPEQWPDQQQVQGEEWSG